ncbi:MAG: hypothetical protein AAGA64_06410 [Bacteroidota bacterium]
MEDLLFDLYIALRVFNISVLADLYSKQMLTGLFIGSVVVSALCALFFYKFYDHPKFQKATHFFLTMIFSIVMNTALYGLVLFFQKKQETMRLNGQGTLFDQSSVDLLLFSLVAGFSTFIIYFLASLFVQPLSTNCSTTPFQFPLTKLLSKR